MAGVASAGRALRRRLDAITAAAPTAMDPRPTAVRPADPSDPVFGSALSALTEPAVALSALTCPTEPSPSVAPWGGPDWTREGGADAAAALSIEITWMIGTTQRVPTARPAPLSVARRESVADDAMRDDMLSSPSRDEAVAPGLPSTRPAELRR